MAFQLPSLPYAYDALEPVIDAQTMRIHHELHHGGYVKKLNLAVGGTDWSHATIQDLLRRLDEIPQAMRNAVRNNGGGHFNHDLFWKCMISPASRLQEEPEGELADEMRDVFGSFNEFKDSFADEALKVFGSGWVWLCLMPDQSLDIVTTANQDGCVMPVSLGGFGPDHTPILGLDLWEHAYYLKHQNDRAAYIRAWWEVVNWSQVEANFLRARNFQPLLNV